MLMALEETPVSGWACYLVDVDAIGLLPPLLNLQSAFLPRFLAADSTSGAVTATLAGTAAACFLGGMMDVVFT